jgi:hypothetical protein
VPGQGALKSLQHIFLQSESTTRHGHDFSTVAMCGQYDFKVGSDDEAQTTMASFTGSCSCSCGLSFSGRPFTATSASEGTFVMLSEISTSDFSWRIDRLGSTLSVELVTSLDNQLGTLRCLYIGYIELLTWSLPLEVQLLSPLFSHLGHFTLDSNGLLKVEIYLWISLQERARDGSRSSGPLSRQ